MPARTVKARIVKDIMTRDPVRVTADTSARELARVLESNEISGVPVVDAQDRVIGVVSRTDLLRRCVEGPLGSRPGSFLEAIAEGLDRGRGLEAAALGSVEDFMSGDPVTAGPDETLPAAAARMAEERVHRIVVVDPQRRCLGIVTSLDLLREFPAQA